MPCFDSFAARRVGYGVQKEQKRKTGMHTVIIYMEIRTMGCAENWHGHRWTMSRVAPDVGYRKEQGGRDACTCGKSK